MKRGEAVLKVKAAGQEDHSGRGVEGDTTRRKPKMCATVPPSEEQKEGS